MTNKLQQLLEIKIVNYTLKGHYNPLVSAQYAVADFLNIIKNSVPEHHEEMLDMEIEDALISQKNLTSAI